MAKKIKGPISGIIHDRYQAPRVGMKRVKREREIKKKGRVVGIETYTERIPEETGKMVAGTRDMAFMEVEFGPRKNSKAFKDYKRFLEEDVAEHYYKGLEDVAKFCVLKWQKSIEDKGGENEEYYIGVAIASKRLYNSMKVKRIGKTISIYTTSPYFRFVEEGWNRANISKSRVVEWMEEKGIKNQFIRKGEYGRFDFWKIVTAIQRKINEEHHPGRYYFRIAVDETIKSRVFIKKVLTRRYKLRGRK